MLKKSKYHKYISVVILGASLALFLWYFSGHREQFRPLLHINIFYLILLGLANVGSLALNGIFIKIVLQPFKKTIGIAESFYVSLISSAGNYFAPVGAGLGFRAVYLKRKHNLSYGDFMATVSGNYVLVFLVTSLSGLVALGLERSYAGHKYWVLFFVFLALFLVDLILMSVRVARIIIRLLRKTGRVGFLVRILSKIIEGWLLIITNKKLVWHLIGLTAIGYPLSLAMSFLILHSLHFHTSFGGLLLLVSLSSLSVFINITPGNVGIKEAVFIFSAQAIGLNTSQILAYSLIDRGVMFMVLLLLWVPSYKMRTSVSQVAVT